MADEENSGGGVSWGKWIFGGIAVLGAALVAPVVLEKVAEFALGNASDVAKVVGGTALAPDTAAGTIGKLAGEASHFLSSNYASVGDKIGLNVIENNFKTFSGLGGVLGQAGDKVVTTVQNNPLSTGLIAGGAAATGLILGQHTAAVVERRAGQGAPVRTA